MAKKKSKAQSILESSAAFKMTQDAPGLVLTDDVAPENKLPNKKKSPVTEPEKGVGGQFGRTTTGYTRSTGEKVNRVTVFMTDKQRQALKDRCKAENFVDDNTGKYQMSKLVLYLLGEIPNGKGKFIS